MPEYDARDWDVTIGGYKLPWTHNENTFEQFHVPQAFSVTAPLDLIDIDKALADNAPEVVFTRKGEEIFVGILDDSDGTGDEETPDGVITFSGRDQSALFVNERIDKPLPLNVTASSLVSQYCEQHGFKDLSGITRTTENVGGFLSKNNHRITRGLNQHDVLFDLAELTGFVFRVHNRKPYFGPPPAQGGGPPMTQISIEYQKDFSRYHWRKSHRNEDVKVRVLSWNPKTKKKTAYEQGAGSIIITLIRDGFTSDQCKALGIRAIAEAERGLFMMELPDVNFSREDMPLLNDILFSFNITAIANQFDRLYYPTRIHVERTQDHETVNLSLYNAPKAIK